MYAFRVLPCLSNYGRNAGGILLTPSSSYATAKTRVDLETKLGLPERPKKPASPYLVFVKQIFPDLKKDSPNLSFKEAVHKVAEKWKSVDSETKSRMMKEYHDKLEKYPEVVKKYYNSLTDTQRVTLEAAKQEKKELQTKRKVSKEIKKTGKPTRPVGSFGIFVKEQHSKESSQKPFGPDFIKELSQKWKALTPEEKEPYTLKYKEAYRLYEQKLGEWEEEMVRQGKQSLIRTKSRPTTESLVPKKLPVTSKKTENNMLRSRTD